MLRTSPGWRTGKCSIAECIVYDERLPTKVQLVPRPGSSAPAKVGHFLTHFPALHIACLFVRSESGYRRRCTWCRAPTAPHRSIFDKFP